MKPTDKDIVNDALFEQGEVSVNSSLTQIIVALSRLRVPFSDILIHEDSPIMVRMPREWVEINLGEMLRSKIEEFFSTIDPKWQQKLMPDYDERGNPTNNCGRLNFSKDLSDYTHAADILPSRLRCNAFVHGESKLGMTIRRIPTEIPKLAQIGLPVSIADALNRPRGLILVTGPAGNGKSTTMAAMLGYINNYKCAHILTLEDPLEFIHSTNKCIFTQREIPKHVASFKAGFEEALRERTDVIAVGELRNRDTIDTCLEGSDAGLLMISTMHANNAPSAINKFLSFYSDSEIPTKAAQLAECLIAVVSQTLVPTEVNGSSEAVLAYEILVNTPQVSKAIAERDTGQLKKLMLLEGATNERLRSNSLNACLTQMVQEKKITRLDAKNYAYDPEDLERELKKNGL